MKKEDWEIQILSASYASNYLDHLSNLRSRMALECRNVPSFRRALSLVDMLQGELFRIQKLSNDSAYKYLRDEINENRLAKEKILNEKKQKLKSE